MVGPAVPVLRTTRRRALSARLVAQHLDARAADVGDLAVLDVGLADTPYGSARVAAAARTDGLLDDVGRPDGPLPLVWATRGAPHVHRADDLPRLVRALRPVSDADATARLASAPIAEGRALGLEAWRTATAAAARVVAEHEGAVPKGELSRGVSDRVPAPLTLWCPGCDAQHVSALVLQPAALQAGLQLDTSGRDLVLRRRPGWPDVPDVEPDPPAVAEHLGRLLALCGPMTAGEAAALLGTTARALAPGWPEDLVPVDVAGRRAWTTAEGLDRLADAAVEDRAAAPVRLLPPGDPWLQARDRDVVVRDAALRRDVWRATGGPGVVLTGTEVVGTWRARAGPRRAAGRRDTVTVTPVGAPGRRVRSALEDEARRVALARGADDVRLDVLG